MPSRKRVWKPSRKRVWKPSRKRVWKPSRKPFIAARYLQSSPKLSNQSQFVAQNSICQGAVEWQPSISLGAQPS
jgi:hypothetical protein